MTHSTETVSRSLGRDVVGNVDICGKEGVLSKEGFEVGLYPLHCIGNLLAKRRLIDPSTIYVTQKVKKESP